MATQYMVLTIKDENYEATVGDEAEWLSNRWPDWELVSVVRLPGATRYYFKWT